MTALNHVDWPNGAVRRTLPRFAEALAAGAVAALPWSTSVAGILIGLWLLAAVPTLDVAAVRREALSAPGGLPVILVALAAAGLLWAAVPAAEGIRGFAPFLRLLMIPILLAQFRGCGRGLWAGAAFLTSATLLLALAWLSFWANLDFGHGPGVPVKDYITQSGVFTLCAFTLLYVGFERFGERRRAQALAAVALALLFLAGIVYVSTSRTTLVIIPVLLLLFGWRRGSAKALAGTAAAGLALAAVVWATSPYVRMRVMNIPVEIADADARETSSGERLQFWRESLLALREAPILGHGTGTIEATFRRQAAVHAVSPTAAQATNPHNQILAIGIQLGAVGVAALLAMWAVHWRLFLRPGIAAWIGLIAVTQNIVGSLFNSHLMDFTQSWIYVFAVGVCGGIVQADADGARDPDRPARPPPP